MHLNTRVALVCLAASSVLAASLDVSKGTEIIPPDSEEAVKLSHSDNAVKTSPKDKSYTGEVVVDPAFKQPQINAQKLDSTDIEDVAANLRPADKVAAHDDKPVVLNDYDPNNLGVPADKAADKAVTEKDKEKTLPGVGEDSAAKQKDPQALDSGSSLDAAVMPVDTPDMVTPGSTGSGSGSTGSGSGPGSLGSGSSGSSGSTGAGSLGSGSTGSGSTGSGSGSKSGSSSGSTDSLPDTYEDSLTGTISLPSPPGSSSDSTITTPFHSFCMAVSMILFSEVGDKTFLVAALMAMKHPRVTVFTSAFSSLIVMTVLSALLGHALPSLLPAKVTSLMAALLFIVFGIKLLREGLAMDPSTGVEEELEEVESEIEAKELTFRNDDLEAGRFHGEKGSLASAELRRSTSSPKVSDDGLENGSSEIPLYKMRSRRVQSDSTTDTLRHAWKQVSEGVGNLAGLVLSPVWVQVFVMTFLGEWGDRSQVATIAMAAGSDYWFVILGAIAGHAVCTMAAVMGGKLLASKISMRHVTLAGAVSFLVFAVFYFAEGLSLSWSG